MDISPAEMAKEWEKCGLCQGSGSDENGNKCGGCGGSGGSWTTSSDRNPTEEGRTPQTND